MRYTLTADGLLVFGSEWASRTCMAKKSSSASGWGRRNAGVQSGVRGIHQAHEVGHLPEFREAAARLSPCISFRPNGFPGNFTAEPHRAMAALG